MLELRLQLASFNNTNLFLPKYDFNEIEPGDLVIFCMGDSFTYGIGTGFYNSYPAQMEKMLNNHFKGKKVKVFNLGVPGYNSAQILDLLGKNIKNIHPDIIIFLGGLNDHWVFQNRFSENERWFFAKIAALITKGKILKFINVVFENIAGSKKAFKVQGDPKFNISAGKETDRETSGEFIKKANTLRDRALYSKAQMYYEQALEIYLGYKTVLLEQGRCYKLSGDFDKAVEILVKMFVKNPKDEMIYAELKDALIKSGDMQTMLRVYAYLYQCFPRDDIIRKGLTEIYVSIGGDNLLHNDLDRANYFYSKALMLDVSNQHVYHNMLKEITLSRKLYANLERIAGICKKEEILLVFCGYPSLMPSAMRQLAKKQDALLIDLRPYYEIAEKNFPERQYIISENDAHCTKEEYYLMAEVIKNKIIELIGDKKTYLFKKTYSFFLTPRLFATGIHLAIKRWNTLFLYWGNSVNVS